MKKSRKTFSNRKIVVSFITLSIIALLFLAGPVQAFILDLNVDNATPNQGENITFTATFDMERMDKYLPIKNLTLVLDGPEYAECVFDVEGNYLSECKGIVSIERISIHSENEHGYGYGYGYDSDNGHGYDFGYGYGYGYDYGYGGKPINFKYKIVLDTTDYSIGIYDTFLRALIGNEIFSKEGAQITIASEYKHQFYYYYSKLDNNSNMTNQTNYEKDYSWDKSEDFPEMNEDNESESTGGLLSAITGAAFVNIPGTKIPSGGLVIIFLGILGFAIYRFKK